MIYQFIIIKIKNGLLLHITVLASDPCTCLLDVYKVKMTRKNCLNYTMKEEMHGQLRKK